jgi:ATP-dependent Lhr-like helicase
MELFHPLVARWFDKKYGPPTDIQFKAWPVIARGEHTLITAPTGSGKTLTAFLWALNRLISNHELSGATRVLYVSPLKALNNDIQRNLLAPLEELRQVFQEKGQAFPIINALTRSGDTPQSDRRRMLRHPPEILITTPESLNLMLSSVGGRSILGQVDTVILDEIHALISEKRGTYLMTAVDRLVLLAGEFQRVCLSATIKPLDVVAEFIGGYRIEKGTYDPVFVPRSVTAIRSTAPKVYQIAIHLPEEAANRRKRPMPGKAIWEPIVTAIISRIAQNQSTLVFVNSRRLCEKITFMINHGNPYPIAYAHHGSLSRELRYAVEEKLKKGDLKAIVATNSLELGIDIGALDEVILVQSPPSIASALQRLGRAGHRVNATSKGVLFPTHAHDILEAGVLARGIAEHDIESARPVECPLDVLSQIIISMTGTETWDMDSLFAFLKTSHPFRHLSREHFDLVLNMLAGRYADARIRELKARISIDRIDNTVAARKGALLTLYMSGGVIPDRGYFSLRHAESHARIGELDEEFVWEAKLGQIFTLGNQNWKIEKITHNDVLVRPTSSNKTAPPFWIAEAFNRGFHLSEKIAEFLTWINANLGKTDLMQVLSNQYHMDASSAEVLIDFLVQQKEKTRCDLPHRKHLVIEKVSKGPGGAPGNQIILHTFWGGRVNRPFAMALEAAWEEVFDQSLETYADNNCICIILPHDIQPEKLLAMVTQQRAGELIRQQLEGSGFFGARFRECAGRALLVTHNRVKGRLPLWVNRLKSKKLYDAIAGYDDFPILLETWRTCLQDLFDLENLNRILAELESGEIQCSFISSSHPSPMALNGAWRQVNEYMYRDDSRPSANRSMLREDLIEGLLASPGFQPDLPLELIQRFECKRKRESQGYAPDTARALVDWILERVIIPWDEWEILLHRMEKDSNLDKDSLEDALKNRLVCIYCNKTKLRAVAARENIARVLAALYPDNDGMAYKPLFSSGVALEDLDLYPNAAIPLDPEETAHMRMRLLGEWMSFYGPMTLDKAQKKMGMEMDLFAAAVDDLIEAGKVLYGKFTANQQADEICDKENFSILLRMKRVDSIPVFEPRDISELPGFIAAVQGVTGQKDNKEQLYACFEKLACFCASAGLWESDILPARLNRYDTSWLDTAMQESDLLWGGCGKERIYFCFEEDLELLRLDANPSGENQGQDVEPASEAFTSKFFAESGSRYDVKTLTKRSGLPTSQVVEKLWQAVWEGRLTNDTCVALRNGIELKFSLPAGLQSADDAIAAKQGTITSKPSRGLRRRFRKQTSSSVPVGNWYKLGLEPDEELDLVEKAELGKERVRLLLDRYGILFREILFKEQPFFKWQKVFRALRLMELSGEVVSGYFFKEIPGPQFMSHSGFQMLQRLSLDKEVFWINAQDPASMCGLQLQALKQYLPSRLPSNHLVYAGSRLVLTSLRNGNELIFNVNSDDADIQAYIGVLRHLLSRQFRPLKQVTIQTINGRDAARSPYVDALRVAFDVMLDYKQVILYRQQ